MIITTKEATHRTIATSTDPLKLGRWSMVLLSRKAGHCTCIVSVYNPIAKSTGPHSVHQQQLNQLRHTHNYRLPRAALLEDLKQAEQSWIEAGKHLIIRMDANEDVRKVDLTNMLKSCGLRNMLHVKHPHISTTATYERMDKDMPIVAIMTTLPETTTI